MERIIVTSAGFTQHSYLYNFSSSIHLYFLALFTVALIISSIWGAVPAHLLHHQEQTTSIVLCNMIKQKRKQKAVMAVFMFSCNAKHQVPAPQVKAVSDAEALRMAKSGKANRKGWKRMVTKVTFVGESFTYKPAKFECIVRPMRLYRNPVFRACA
ncbi:hypothetical protein ANCCAN_00213 [Ancylostoma caninum]|uniref:Uncharacterized protein n=1 Tax=Ancylostoma caninum TaxID=29170 RepID=A0A368HDL2_ANCCA|nr:hypothetical protein ANCCAN_00213 [Ancylostoma caninum]